MTIYDKKKIFENNLKNIWICSISKGFNVGSYYLATAKRLLHFKLYGVYTVHTSIERHK